MNVRQALIDLRHMAEDPSQDAYQGRNCWDDSKIFQNWNDCQSSLSAIQSQIDDLLWEHDNNTPPLDNFDGETVDIELDDNPRESAGRHQRVQRWLEYRDLLCDAIPYSRNNVRSHWEFVLREDIRQWLVARSIPYRVYKQPVEEPDYDAHFIIIPAERAVEFKLRWF